MDKKRKVYAPFSLTSEAGVAQTPVEGYIDVNQAIYPTVSTGVVNENGKWTGVKSDDAEFIGFTKAEAIGNGEHILFPATNNHPSIDMTGFNDLFIAIKSSATGDIAIRAMSGPDTERFANITVAHGITYKGNYNDGNATLEENIVDSTETLSTADAFFVYMLQSRARNYRNLQFRITNNTGGIANFDFAFMRLV